VDILPTTAKTLTWIPPRTHSNGRPNAVRRGTVNTGNSEARECGDNRFLNTMFPNYWQAAAIPRKVQYIIRVSSFEVGDERTEVSRDRWGIGDILFEF